MAGTSVGAIREMLTEMIVRARDAAPTDGWRVALDGWRSELAELDDAAVLAFVRQVDASAVGRRDVAPLADAWLRRAPEHDLRALAAALPADVAEQLWSSASMMCMLGATVAMVPPQMLQQIEAMAQTMASSAPDLSAAFAALGGGLPGMGVPGMGVPGMGVPGMGVPGMGAPPAPPKRRRARGAASKQDEFRRRLV